MGYKRQADAEAPNMKDDALAGSRPESEQSVSSALVDHTAIFTPMTCLRSSRGTLHQLTWPGNSPSNQGFHL